MVDRRSLQVAVIILLLGGMATLLRGDEATTRGSAEHFERRVRPLLVAKCYSCHGDIAQPKGELSLTTRDGLLRGGSRGPAVDLQHPEQSLLLRAIRRDPANDLAMPPKMPLSDTEIHDLTQWIADGVPWSAAEASRPAAGDGPRWALQPLLTVAIPDAGAPTTIDAFLNQAIESAGLRVSEKTDRATLLRRVTFDLIGLPPTPEEIRAFIEDRSADPFASVVDRLLASPHYGERWGRHWLDVIGYAETDGHEYDPDKPNVYRYRDYVIDALNQDLPYDQFVLEQLAGDLLVPSRFDSEERIKLSSVATGSLWLGEVQAVPVDPALSLAIETERQIDVIGKAFFGLTLACARCHDHKFDPIPTRDYYSLAGCLQSTRRVQACVDSEAQQQKVATAHAEARRLKQQIDELLSTARRQKRGEQVQNLSAILLATMGPRVRDDAMTQAWLDYFDKQIDGRDPIFYAWSRLSRDAASGDFAHQVRALGNQLASLSGPDRGVEVFEDFEKQTYEGWQAVGEAFAKGPVHPEPSVQDGYNGSGMASSFGGTDRLIGRLVSRPFTIERGYIGFWIAGGKEPGRTCLNITEEVQVLPKLTATGAGNDELVWKVLDARTLVGRQAQIELVDESLARGGHLLVDHIVFSDVEPLPDRPPNPAAVAMLRSQPIGGVKELAEAYQRLFEVALSRAEDALQPGEVELLRWLLAGKHPWQGTSDEECLSTSEREMLTQWRGDLARLEQDFPSSAIALVAEDGSGHDVCIQISGQPENLGERVPRGVLTVLSESATSPAATGSGRLDMARRLIADGRQLLARVMVNRLWQYHFGRGIVETPDNFGALGARPSHPELLDYLAHRFIESGWSIKAMHREMLRTDAYQRSSRSLPEVARRDPDNQLLTHMPVLRLDAECIRDAMLAVTGALDPVLHGPSIPLYVTPSMEGRDVPAVSGPVDGCRRRSIYLEVRRNHQSELFAAFDAPRGNSTMGRRPVSTVPAQALTLLNDEFVWQLADQWAQNVLSAGEEKDAVNIRTMYLAALGREASESTVTSALAFLGDQEARYQHAGMLAAASRTAAYRDLAHVFLNLAEFIHVY